MNPRPILIVGSGRSGTSILTWCLGQHRNIHTVPETDWKTALASWADGLYKIGMMQHPSGHFSRWDVSREAFLEQLGIAIDGIIRRTFEARFPDRRVSLRGSRVRDDLAWFRSIEDPKIRWADGTPSSTGYAGILAEMFPAARFINLVREPESVVKSWMGASFRAADMAKSSALVEHIYHSQRAGYLTHAAFGERTLRVVFEKVTADPEAMLRSILEFLGEEYSADCAKPLAEKINSSGQTKQAVLDEYASIADSDMLREMRSWYAASADPEWRIEDDPELAREHLALYERYRIPQPG